MIITIYNKKNETFNTLKATQATAEGENATIIINIQNSNLNPADLFNFAVDMKARYMFNDATNIATLIIKLEAVTSITHADE